MNIVFEWMLSLGCGTFVDYVRNKCTYEVVRVRVVRVVRVVARRVRVVAGSLRLDVGMIMRKKRNMPSLFGRWLR